MVSKLRKLQAQQMWAQIAKNIRIEDTVTAVEVFERTRVGIEIDDLNLLSSKVEKSPESNNCEIQSKNIVNRHSHCERNI